MPFCPHCLVEIKYDEMMDDYFNGAFYEVNWRGFCPSCEKRFIWTETYNYCYLTNFKEEIENG